MRNRTIVMLVAALLLAVLPMVVMAAPPAAPTTGTFAAKPAAKPAVTFNQKAEFKSDMPDTAVVGTCQWITDHKR